MKVELANGNLIELGELEAAPTIGIIDYSRRVTDDFGVTNVVERGFARRMSVRLGIDFDDVDRVQRRLANLRAKPARWIADDRFRSLDVQGFYKDFSIDLSVPPLSYCTLTVEGLAETAPPADTGTDPAPTGMASTLRLLQPMTIDDAALFAASVPEADYPTWSASTLYPAEARVISTATHRIYERLSAGSGGAVPATGSTAWLDIGPTNRWAMLDGALGTATTATDTLTVTIDAEAATAVALLDVEGATVRVQAPAYDSTQAVGVGTLTFLDLPPSTGHIIVTVTGSGTVSVGTLLIGRLVSLGVTEASPTAGITDYSRKEVDEFGAITVVQRAWAKKMSARALISTEALDLVADRIAAVRARPSLWIGSAGIDSLTVFGFFKEFSIEVGESVSKLSLSIEGLSEAAKIAPIGGSTDWPDVGDPDGTKPDDNATVGAPPGTPVGDKLAEEVTALISLNGENILGATLRGDALLALIDARTWLDGETVGTRIVSVQEQVTQGLMSYAQDFALLAAKNTAGTGMILNASGVYIDADRQLTQVVQSLEQETGEHDAAITELNEILFDGSGATLRSVNTMTLDGAITGTVNTLTGEVGTYTIYADVFRIVNPNGGQPYTPFTIGDDGVVEMISVRVKTLAYEALVPLLGGTYNQLASTGGYQRFPGGFIIQWGQVRKTIADEQMESVSFPISFPNAVMSVTAMPYIAQFSNLRDLWLQNVGAATTTGCSFVTQAATGNAQTLDGFDWMAFGW